ncbi:MAG: pyridoxal-phosphate dependent enzyme [Bryobacterales bacterium]|nr:pyridoxal-phosphate dependent enzyme [Bryobacteraceae bacterium]MDW8355084.1 pyridoxal-phosphate dependent enzyme [Bryobacterales bacterium]
MSSAQTLGEGPTPLVASAGIAARFGLARLAFKLEIRNPTGSYKDRFIAAELAHQAARAPRAVVATSSGNTGSALAAYAARRGLRCLILLNEQAPAGKLLEMKAHGAEVVRVRGFGSSDEATRKVFDLLERFAVQRGLPTIVSAYRYCPVGMAGVEGLGRELVAQTNGAWAHVFVPVGGGGLYTAVCRGLDRRWPVHAVQPEGCSTVVAAWRRNLDRIVPVRSTTRISGLSVPFDIDASAALAELRATGGQGVEVTDEEIYEAQRLLARLEGILAEPAGAAALAGLLKLVRQGRFDRDEPAICLVTGSGFKDPESLTTLAEAAADVLVSLEELPDLLREKVHS